LSPFGGSTRRGRVDIILFLAQSTSTLRAPPPKEDSEAGCKIFHPALRAPPPNLKYRRDKSPQWNPPWAERGISSTPSPIPSL